MKVVRSHLNMEGVAMSNEITTEGEAYRAYFNAGISEMMSRMWGGNLHIGLFEHETESLEMAQSRLKARLGKALGLPAGAHVIEAGCGVGTTALFLARCCGLRVHATNISEEQLEEARRRAREEGLENSVTFEAADYHHLPAEDASFDGWLCQEALLYARDRPRVFDEALRVVRPGGRLVFTDLTLSRSMPATAREELTRVIRAPYLWSREEYSGFVSDLGLAVVDHVESLGNAELTFRAVLHNLASLEGEFVTRAGRDAYDEARARISSQYEAARQGSLGWCLYCLQVPG